MTTFGISDTFSEATVRLGDIAIHCVRGGAGPAMLLLHGFPQDWYEWRTVMPQLARRHSVIAVDLRGVGGSDAPDTGYDAATMADDVHRLVQELGVGPAHLVGHDVGGWVAYACARLHPETTSRVTILETLIPGTRRFADPRVDVPLWHGEFHMVPELPETLVAGRQAAYFKYFFDVGTRGTDVITEADIAHYAGSYGDVARLHAAFEMYRAVPQNVEFNLRHRDPISTPLRLIGGEQVFGPGLADSVDELRDDFGWTDVEAHIVPDGQHYIVEERPEDVVTLLESGDTSRSDGRF
jgi:pimeloyl-ACP methyl ester carboxylesterase